VRLRLLVYGIEIWRGAVHHRRKPLGTFMVLLGMWMMDVVIKLKSKYDRYKKYAKVSKMTDISFITDTITIYRNKRY